MSHIEGGVCLFIGQLVLDGERRDLGLIRRLKSLQEASAPNRQTRYHGTETSWRQMIFLIPGKSLDVKFLSEEVRIRTLTLSLFGEYAWRQATEGSCLM